VESISKNNTSTTVLTEIFRLSVGILTGYRPEVPQVEVPFLVGARKFSLLHNVRTSFGTHPSYPWGTGALSPKVSSQSMKLTTRIHLVATPIMVELYLHSSIHLNGVVL
jgi:hypothetical protein